MLSWQRHIRQLNQQKPKFVLLTSLLPFLTTEGSRVLEKKVNETQVSKTVFSHLEQLKSAVIANIFLMSTAFTISFIFVLGFSFV